MPLSNEEKRRYARHLALPEVGAAGQEKLRAARVLCVGVGGLGSPAALYLAAAGVGTLGLVDFDTVDVANLQRQILHGTADVGRLKTESAHDALSRLNPTVAIQLHPCRLDATNARDILAGYDLVVDGSDNFPTRYLTNDACVLLGKPCIYGSVAGFSGQASVFAPHRGGPCYRCLFPEPPAPGTTPNCVEGGVLGVLPGVIGCLQATETLKLILGVGQPLLGRLLVFDALALRFRELKLRRDPACPVCGEHPRITELVQSHPGCAGRGGAAATPAEADEVSVAAMQRALASPNTRVCVVDVREPDETRAFRLEGTVLLPLSELPGRFRELDPGRTHYLLCHAGVRSRHAVAFLRAQGFASVHSVRGGLVAWQSGGDAG
jgi:adenylyltransferase/sulfurtransferase